MSDSAEPKGKDDKKVGETPPPEKVKEATDKRERNQRFQKGTEVQK